METLLNAINCKKYEWNICGGLKVTDLLLGLMVDLQSTVAFDVFAIVELLSSIAKVDWEPSEGYVPGQHNVKFWPLIDPQSLFTSTPLYIKWGLIKNFVKALDKIS